MRSTTAFVTKTVSRATGACITKPARTTMSSIVRSSQCTVSHTRSFYTVAAEFGLPRSVPSFSPIQFPSSLDSMKLGSMKLDLHLGMGKAYPREIVFLGGAPGAGKGTNSAHVSELRGYDAPTIVVSDLLNTPSCKALKERGVMVDDDFVFNVLLKELEKPIYRNGVVVDGFPRTAKQAEFLSNFHAENNSPWSPAPRILFVMLHIDEADSINRQQSRGQEILALNAERSVAQLPLLEVRSTDIHIDASKARYAVFNEQLDAVMGLRHQFPLVVVDASSTLDVVRESLATQMATLPL